MSSLTSIGIQTSCMTILAGAREVAWGCFDGKIVIVHIREHMKRKEWLVHSEHLEALAICIRANFIISGSRDKTLKIWKIGIWELLDTLSEHSERITSIQVSPDEKRIFSASNDGVICVWNLKTKAWFRKINTDDQEKLQLVTLPGRSDELILSSCNGVI